MGLAILLSFLLHCNLAFLLSFLLSRSTGLLIFVLSLVPLGPNRLFTCKFHFRLVHFSPTDFMFRLTTDSTFFVTFLSFIAVVPVIVIFFTADVMVEATS